MPMRFHIALLWMAACVLPGCGPQGGGTERQPETVSVFAAASTKEAIEQVARDFQSENGISVEVSLGPSSGLAKQIEQGAAADIFLSADQASADYLAAKQLVSERRNFLTNRLVVVVPTAADVDVRELRDLTDPRIRRLAL